MVRERSGGGIEPFLEALRDVAVFASSGSLFQSLMDLGKKEGMMVYFLLGPDLSQIPVSSSLVVPRCAVVLWIGVYQMVGHFAVPIKLHQVYDDSHPSWSNRLVTHLSELSV